MGPPFLRRLDFLMFLDVAMHPDRRLMRLRKGMAIRSFLIGEEKG